MESLVLLPEMMCDARLFAPQIEALSRDHPVTLAPVTHGERIEEIASTLLDHLPLRFALAGLGFGGMVAMELLRRAPDRVTRLCLIATSPLPETPQQASLREPRIIAARSGRMMEVIEEDMPAAALAPGAGRAAVMARFRAMAADQGSEVFVAQTRALQRRRDQQPVLRRVKQPALLVCGAHDTLTPVKRHEFMADLIPYARLQIIDEAGHLPPIETPEEMTRILRDWMRQPLVLR